MGYQSRIPELCTPNGKGITKMALFDGLFVSEFEEHGSEICHKLTQPTEDIILSRNARLRQNPGAIRDLGQGQEGGTWGRQVASIPVLHWHIALKQGFALEHKDKQIREKELLRFLQTPLGRQSIIQEKPNNRVIGGFNGQQAKASEKTATQEQ